MEGGARILGHHIHPIMIVFPLGLLSGSLIFDVLYWITSNSEFAIVAYWLVPAGIIGGLLAAIFGWIDWFAIPTGTRARSIGLIHGLVNVVVMILFLGSWFLRESSGMPTIISTILTVTGAGVALVGGWLGGELVERLSIGVHTGAGPNAPSSLKVPDLTVGAKERSL